MAGSLNLTIDESGMIPLMRGINDLEDSLKRQTNGRLRDAANVASTQLVRALKAAAAGAQTPQAKIVAETVEVKRDRFVAVSIGGAKPVGHRGTPAYQILWGSERGGRNFGASAGGRYWIEPTVTRFHEGPAQQAYMLAVHQILNDAGLT